MAKDSLFSIQKKCQNTIFFKSDFNDEYLPRQADTENSGNIGHCYPWKTTVNGGEQWFSRGYNFQCYPLLQSIIILYLMLVLNKYGILTHNDILSFYMSHVNKSYILSCSKKKKKDIKIIHNLCANILGL